MLIVPEEVACNGASRINLANHVNVENVDQIYVQEEEKEVYVPAICDSQYYVLQ